MHTYTQVNMLKHVNNSYVAMQQHEHEQYDADSVYDDDAEQLYAAAYVTDTQVELADDVVCELNNEVLLFSSAACDSMYNNILQVYYMHIGSFNYNFYVKTAQLAQLQLVQHAQAVA